jgi:DNA modification methylase
VLVDATNRIIAGEGRWKAAKLLGLARVPVVRVTHLSPAQRRAYLLADNRLAELAGWDQELLRLEFGELLVEAPELDLTVSGFDMGEIDRLLLGEEFGAEAVDAEADALPALQSEVVCRPGDLWLLGEHRLLIGDARDLESYRRLLGGEPAALVFADPPYNVPIEGNARGLGRHRHREFAMASGELGAAEFAAFLEGVFAAAAAVSHPGAVHYICMDWRHLRELLAAGDAVYGALLNVIVWDKGVGGMGSLYRSQHELIFAWRVKGGRHRNNVGLGRFGRNRTNVWRHPGVNSFGTGRDALLAMHPTAKPVALVAGAILDASKRGEIILDPFAGSGTTIIAAHKTGRIGMGIELDPAYGDVIARRFERYAGNSPVHAGSGLTFAEEAERRREASSASGGDRQKPAPRRNRGQRVA